MLGAFADGLLRRLILPEPGGHGEIRKVRSPSGFGPQALPDRQHHGDTARHHMVVVPEQVQPGRIIGQDQVIFVTLHRLGEIVHVVGAEAALHAVFVLDVPQNLLQGGQKIQPLQVRHVNQRTAQVRVDGGPKLLPAPLGDPEKVIVSLALRRQDQPLPPLGTAKQGNAQFLFQRADLPAHCLPAHIFFLGGLGEAQSVRRAEKYLDIGCVHCVHLPPVACHVFVDRLNCFVA